MKNTMIKKFLSLALAVGMMGSMVGTVFADVNNIDENTVIANAAEVKYNISDLYFEIHDANGDF